MTEPLGPARRPVRALIVAGSPFMRAYLRRVLETSGRVEVVAAVATLDDALQGLRIRAVDVVLLDLDGLDLPGFEWLRRIMLVRPTPVLVLAPAAAVPAPPPFRGLPDGAVGWVVKPSEPVATARQFARELLARVEAAAAVPPGAWAHLKQELASADTTGGGLGQAAARLGHGEGRPTRRVVALGASTGGPHALEALVRELPAGLPATLLVTQHMPKGFTASLARRLSEVGPIPFYEAYEGAPLEEGVGYVAVGGWHLTVGDDGRLHLDDGPPVHHVRPAVDVMFASVARRFGPEALAVVLTGMGSDGTEGARLIRAAGGTCFAQDERSAVAPSMPRSVVKAGLADRVGTPEELAAAVAQWVWERQARARQEKE